MGTRYSPYYSSLIPSDLCCTRRFSGPFPRFARQRYEHPNARYMPATINALRSPFPPSPILPTVSHCVEVSKIGTNLTRTCFTHISPSATMQMVCQTPRPIRGVTPRYNPFIPLEPYIYLSVLPTVRFLGRFGSTVLLCISTRMTSIG